MLNTFLTYKHCMSYQNETTLNEFLRKDVRLYCDGETYFDIKYTFSGITSIVNTEELLC